MSHIGISSPRTTYDPVIAQLRDLQRQDKAGSGKTERSKGGQSLPSHPKTAREQGAQTLTRPSNALRRFSAALAGVGTALRVLVAIGTVGISEGLVALGKKAVDACSGKSAAPKNDIRLTDPVSGKQISAKSSIGPTKVPSGMTTEKIRTSLQEKVNAGHALLQQIRSGALEGTGRTCTVEDMTNIMFAMQVHGEAQKGSFKEGAFNIPDPGQRIRKFLDSCPESYQRESSHIGGFQRMGAGKHRGIDAYGNGGNMKEMLPNGMKTLLYGSIPQSDALKMPHDRLYMKIESHGAWLTRPKGGHDDSGPGRTANRHDIGAFLGHSLSFIATRGQGSAGGTFKERIPDSVKNDFKALLKAVPESMREMLGSDNPTDSAMGLRIMYQNARAVQSRLNGDALQVLSPFRDKLNAFIAGLASKYDHLDVRIGNEIIM